MSKTLTEKERKALDLTNQLWNALIEIEDEHKMHPDEIHEHRRDVHDIQTRIMARVVARLEPDNFFVLPKIKNT